MKQNKFLSDVTQAMKNNEAAVQMLEVINKKINYLKEQNDENNQQAFTLYDDIADIADGIKSHIDYTTNICRDNLENVNTELIKSNTVINNYNQVIAEQEMNDFRQSGKAFIFSENIITDIDDLVNDINMTRTKKNVMIKYVTNKGEYDLRWLDNNQTTDFITSNWSPDFKHHISKKISIVPFDIGTWGTVMMLKGDILVEYFDLR